MKESIPNQLERIQGVIAGKFSEDVLTDGDVKYLRVVLFHLIKREAEKRRKQKAN